MARFILVQEIAARNLSLTSCRGKPAARLRCYRHMVSTDKTLRWYWINQEGVFREPRRGIGIEMMKGEQRHEHAYHLREPGVHL